jgi:hypothetical protein
VHEERGLGMKKMNNWEDVLEFVHKCGLEGSKKDTIQIRQDRLMAAVRAIERTAGVPEGVKGDVGYPFWLDFEPYRDTTGFNKYPWLGKATVWVAKVLELETLKR